MSAVTQVRSASPEATLSYFSNSLAFETDCWDVHDAMTRGNPDFVLIDVRSPESFAKGHIQGALNIPHGTMSVSKFEGHPYGTLFVVYCAGPHCNGAQKGAVLLATFGHPVKLMLGGITGWLDEGFPLTSTESPQNAF